jgi:AGCS family alanine or glycine:cation symporter
MVFDFYTIVQFLEEFIWIVFGFPLIMGLGLYLSIKSRFVQVRKFPHILRSLWGYAKVKDLDDGTVHPLKAFFAAVGGCIGIGNLVAICTAVQIGGPGALFWIWLTAAVGVMLKYAEVYLGIRYRVSNDKGGYNGGPMYFIPHAIKGSWAPLLLCFFLCIYGVEIYQFSVITTSVAANFGFNLYAVIVILLGLVLYACSGGIQRVGAI